MLGAGLSWIRIVGDLVHFLCLGLRSMTSLAAENLFLRKQLVFRRRWRSTASAVIGDSPREPLTRNAATASGDAGCRLR
jgi:hypothetical protein